MSELGIHRLKRGLPSGLKALVPAGVKKTLFKLLVPRRKLFGIGLPKTATTSLTEALAILGYSSIHYPRHGHEIWRYETATDAPVAAHWRELEHEYPGSRFILTLRELESWLESCREHFHSPKDNPYRLALFGANVFDEAKFRDAYARHHASIREHFRERPSDLLELDICAGQGWEVSLLLERPIPGCAIPVAEPRARIGSSQRHLASERALAPSSPERR